MSADQDRRDVVRTATDNRSDRAQHGVKRAEGADSQRDVGTALRSVYQKTVEEHVPDEMLDLLSKLG